MKNKRIIIIVGVMVLLFTLLGVLSLLKSTDVNITTTYSSLEVVISKKSGAGCIGFGEIAYDFKYLLDYENNQEYYEAISSVGGKVYNYNDIQIAYAETAEGDQTWYQVDESQNVSFEKNYRDKFKQILNIIADSDLKKVKDQDHVYSVSLNDDNEFISLIKLFADEDYDNSSEIEVSVKLDNNNVSAIYVSLEEIKTNEYEANNCYDLVFNLSNYNNVSDIVSEEILEEVQKNKNIYVGNYQSVVTCSNGNSYTNEILLTDNLKKSYGNGILINDINELTLMDCNTGIMIVKNNVDYYVKENKLVLDDEYEFKIIDSSLQRIDKSGKVIEIFEKK